MATPIWACPSSGYTPVSLVFEGGQNRKRPFWGFAQNSPHPCVSKSVWWHRSRRGPASLQLPDEAALATSGALQGSGLHLANGASLATSSRWASRGVGGGESRQRPMAGETPQAFGHPTLDIGGLAARLNTRKIGQQTTGHRGLPAKSITYQQNRPTSQLDIGRGQRNTQKKPPIPAISTCPKGIGSNP